MGMIGRIRSRLDTDSDTCKHVRDDIWPAEDKPIWYLLEKKYGEKNWSERDAAYVEQISVTKHLVCLGCGEERTIETGELVGGRDGIKLKEEMDADERQFFRVSVHGGAFFNGFDDT